MNALFAYIPKVVSLAPFVIAVFPDPRLPKEYENEMNYDRPVETEDCSEYW